MVDTFPSCVSLTLGIREGDFLYIAARVATKKKKYGDDNVSPQKKRILLVTDHNALREALAVRLNQEEDLEVAWQTGSIADTRNVHLNGVDVAVVEPFLPDGDGLVLVREVSVANPNALALVLTRKLDPSVHDQAIGAGAAEVLNTKAQIEELVNAIRRTADAE
jgi:DNA-binding NarL/FixJ family response regulator